MSTGLNLFKRKGPGDRDCCSRDVGDAKKQRIAVAAPGGNTQNADRSGPGAAFDAEAAALSRAKLAPRVAVHTTKLAMAIQPGPFAFLDVVSVIDLLAADAARPESLLDLSFVPAGDELCILFQLLRFFRSCSLVNGDSPAVFAQKTTALQLIDSKVMPLVPLLLRSFDPATVDAATGNNALLFMCTHFSLDSAGEWPYKFFVLLFKHGVSMHARNRQGRTLLLQSAAGCGWLHRSAAGLLMFLRSGFDLNAQDNGGEGVPHHLVARTARDGLMNLLNSDGVDGLDLWLLNSADHTAADVAATVMAEVQLQIQNAQDHEAQQLLEIHARAWHIHQLLFACMGQWEQLVQPLLLRTVESVLPVADVAKPVLGYIDGSGLPLAAAAAEAEPHEDDGSDEDDEPAAATAAAQF